MLLAECFLQAVKENDIEKVKACLALGVDVNAIDEEGKTALILAIERESLKIYDLLLSQGNIDVNKPKSLVKEQKIFQQENKLNAQEDLIAIIGLSCRFPQGSDTPDAYWHLLQSGEDGISEVPKSRWDIGQYYDPNSQTPGKMVTRRGDF